MTTKFDTGIKEFYQTKKNPAISAFNYIRKF